MKGKIYYLLKEGDYYRIFPFRRQIKLEEVFIGQSPPTKMDGLSRERQG